MGQPTISKDQVNTWVEFFQDPAKKSDHSEFKSYYDEILNIVDKDIDSLYVNFLDIAGYSDLLADRLIEHPEEVMLNAERAIYDLTPADAQKNIFFRITHLPVKTNLWGLKGEIGAFVSLDAMVKKVRQKYKLLEVGHFRCQKCGFEMNWPQHYPDYAEPYKCQNENCDREATKTSFEFIESLSTFVDAEDITIEDPRDTDILGDPYQFKVLATDDLTQQLVPGQRITLNGILRTTQRERIQKKLLKFDQYIFANSFEDLDEYFDVKNLSSEEKGMIIEFSKRGDLFETLQTMIAPLIFGLEDVKEALLLFLFGGVEKIRDDHHIRGDIHILLVGDPGLAKSQILKHISNLAPKAIYTSGKASTAAGLTATAKQDEDGWYIEGGALPAADRGVICIDEIDKMRDVDRSSIHESMEQQTVSVSKAAIHMTLNTRCSILAAANPKDGRYDIGQSIASQVNLEPVILSRFGLIYPIIDKVDEDIDREMAKFILGTHRDMTQSMRDTDEPEAAKAKEKMKLPMTTQEFRMYISYAKTFYNPIIPEELEDRIIEFYTQQRQLSKPNKTDWDDREDESPIRISLTPRQIEDVIRLTEARARIRLSNIATEEDTRHAIRILSNSLDKVATSVDGHRDIDLLYFGKSAEYKNLTNRVMKIINEEHKNYDNGVPVAVIKALAGHLNPPIDKKWIHETLTHLSTNGKIFYTTYRKDRVLPMR